MMPGQRLFRSDLRSFYSGLKKELIRALFDVNYPPPQRKQVAGKSHHYNAEKYCAATKNHMRQGKNMSRKY